MAAGPSDPKSVSQEIQRLRKRNEQHRSLVRLEKAIDHRNKAQAALSKQCLTPRQWPPNRGEFERH